MSNKTALQELIEDLKAEHSGLQELVKINKESGYQPDYAEGGMKKLEYAINKATELLEKQKNQIMDAYNDGWLHGEKKNYFKTSEQYFNQKYTNNK